MGRERRLVGWLADHTTNEKNEEEEAGLGVDINYFNIFEMTKRDNTKVG